MKKKTLKVEVTDMYRLLISELRYGYTRNNHLMPNGAYRNVDYYLPLMEEVDSVIALHTAEQLCEECIDQQLVTHFSNGEDDENGNRQDAIEFVQKMINYVRKTLPGWEPYNYHNYVDNLAKDEEPIYDIYESVYYPLTELPDDPEVQKKLIKKVNVEKLSKNNVLEYLFLNILKAKVNDTVTYRRFPVGTGLTRYVFDDKKLAYIIVNNRVKGEDHE